MSIIYSNEEKLKGIDIIAFSEMTLSGFSLDKKAAAPNIELELSKKAGEYVGKIYDAFIKQYNNPDSAETQKSLNILCVRLVFCLYAEDAGLFSQNDSFSRYIGQYEPKDIRRALIDLFEVLDTPEDSRKAMYLSEELASFPYVNGRLFAIKGKNSIEIPQITEEIKQILLDSAKFDWSGISPTIFGAVFESTLNPDTRRKGGMHYTSIENIHKAIDPLFLDGLKAEFAAIAAETGENATPRQYALAKKKLLAFQEKLSSLKSFEMKTPKLIQINYSSAAMPRGYIFGRRVHFAGRVHPGCFCA